MQSQLHSVMEELQRSRNIVQNQIPPPQNVPSPPQSRPNLNLPQPPFFSSNPLEIATFKTKICQYL